MPYIPDLNQVQLGKETARGTVVAGTAKLGLVESASISAEIEGNNLPDVRASLAPGYVATLDSHKGSAKIVGVCTYEDLQYHLDSLLALVTPTGANPYVYESAAPLTAAPTRRFSSLIFGQTGAIKTLSGAICNELTISIESNKPWKYSASYFGKTVVDGALASLSDRTQTPIHANNTTIAVDAWAGTMGATVLTCGWFKAELSIKSNSDNYMGIGSLNPAGYRDAKYETSLKIQLETIAASAAYVTSILASSLLQHQVRIKATTGATAIAQLDFAGSHLSAPEFWSDADGVLTAEFELTGLYNPTLANFLKTSITNAVATLP
jgi:hypothetical protein